MSPEQMAPTPNQPGGMAAATPDIVSMQGMIERQVALEWYECVALVAGLCSAVAGREPAFIPFPGDCLVTPDGGIVVIDGARATDDMDLLPRLLNALLDGANPPPPLRLFVLHAISSGDHPSARSFGEALAYYERPGRADLIKAAYRRYLETPAVKPQTRRFEVTAQPAAPAPEKAPRGRGRLWAVGVVTVVLSSAIALTIGQGGTARADGVESAGAIEAFASQAGGAARSVATVIRQALGEEVAPPDSSEPADVTAAPAPARRPAAGRSTPGGRRRAPAGRSPAAGVEDRNAAGNAAVHGVTGEPADAAANGPISAGEIEPPVLIDPVRLPAAVRFAEEGSAGAMEVMVTEGGTVERVRFLAPSGRMTDMMLLSAAKTWIFLPATRDGRPVPYRVVLNWTALR